jgi:tRNA (mo5U34)-methyltransferase
VPVAGDRPVSADPSQGDLKEKVAGISWYHSIDLGAAGGGIVTPGNPPDENVVNRGLPDLEGKTVLDIGAWDGFWSFLAEKRGAAQVTAMDHYAWCVDFPKRLDYWERCEKEGTTPDFRLDFTEFWRPETMPGRAGFDLARNVLGSSVEPIVSDFMDADPAVVGTFDVVFFLGVLYHLREPLTALERVKALTREVAVIETEAIAVLAMPNARFLEFHESGGLRGDYTNWFVPTEKALHALCDAAGFSRVETKVGPPPTARLVKSAARRMSDRSPASDRRDRDISGAAVTRYRIVVHAYP